MTLAFWGTWAVVACLNHPTSTSPYEYFIHHPVLSLPIVALLHAIVFYAFKAATSLVSKPVESASTVLRVVQISCDPTKFIPTFNLWAKKFNDKWRTFNTYEILHLRRPLVTSIFDCAAIGRLFNVLEPMLLSTFPNSPNDVWHIVSGLSYAAAYAVARCGDILVAGTASLYDTSSPATWACLGLFAPGVLLHVASLSTDCGKRYVASLSPVLKKYYIQLIVSVLMMLFLVECFSLSFSTFALSPCSGYTSYIFPSCWRSGGVPSSPPPRPSQAAAAFSVSIVSALDQALLAYQVPKNATVAILEEALSKLLLSVPKWPQLEY